VTARDPIQRLVRALARLPGVGEKTATRLAFHILRAPEGLARELAEALVDVKENVRLCSRCMNLTSDDPCTICSDTRRDDRMICVVASPPDLHAIERTGGYRGRYHVLHGVLSPLDGVGPDDLRIRELLLRVGSGSAVQEVILATSPNVEGEATALYLGKVLRPLGVRVTRIASGLQVGGELEYADQMTIARALDARRDL
jgi:recombination protein RecR